LANQKSIRVNPKRDDSPGLKFRCLPCGELIDAKNIAKHTSGINKCKLRSSELFCPIANCSRSDSNSTKKPFKTFKLLKQHFLIKHQQKSFKCDQCSSHFHDSVALKSHVQVCGKLVCQTCSKSYRATDGLEKHLRAHKTHLPTQQARVILENIKRKPQKTYQARIIWQRNGPIRARGSCDVGTQVELSLTTTSTGNSQTDIDYQFCETHEWGGQTTEIPWEDSGIIQSSRGDVHVTSTEIQTSNDDEYFLGNSSVRDVGHQLFSTKPVEIQTDPIQSTMNDMNLQTDFGELEWNDFQVEFDSAGTQTDFSLENLGLNLIQR
jgi:hypothetical protein